MRPRRVRRGRSLSTAIVCSGFVVVVVALFLGLLPRSLPADTAPPARNEETVMLPTPMRAIAKGERIQESEFIEVAWPKSRDSARYLHDVREYPNAVSLNTLPPHLPIQLAALDLDRADSNAVVEGIPSGMRAITVKVDAESAVEGWARSGNYIDVILLRNAVNNAGGIVAKVIAENVRILSAGRSTEPLSGQTSAPRAPTTVTILVTQENALKIKTASTIGKLTFSLRGLGDANPTLARSVNQTEILDSAKNYVPKAHAYTGRAVGPDGKTYVLGDDSRWVRLLKAADVLQAPESDSEQR